MENFDVVVLGAGPGGYVAAIRCAQLGFKTAVIEGWKTPAGEPALGGTCLNVGCIPSKALLDSSHHFEFLTKHAQSHGISANGISVDIATMQGRKDQIVKTLTQGIAGLFKKNKITWIQGWGQLQPDSKVAVLDTDGRVSQQISAAHIIVATGSIPMAIPVAKVDHQHIVDSTGALNFTTTPATLGVIGAGVIGLELGSVWRRLGARVTVFEALPEFLMAADQEIAKEAAKIFKKQGLDIRLGAKVTGTEVVGGKVQVSVTSNDKNETFAFDKLIVAVGRAPYTERLNAEGVGLKRDARGFIEIDALMRTNIPNVYAIGDAVKGPMLAHKASEEGVAVAEIIAGQKPHLDHATIPWVIYTWPEIAWAGQTEQALKAAGQAYKAGKFPFAASGRARAMGDTDGFVKVLADAQTDALLGVHCIGPHASELISEAVLALAFGGSAEDIARTIHAHPTLAETFHEAALGIDKRTLHF